MLGRKDKILCWMIIYAAVLGPSPVRAAANTPHITGMFSGITRASEGGDLEGTEMWLVNSNQGYWVVLQAYNDMPVPPVMAKLVAKGNTVSFVIPTPSEAAGSYTGRVTENGFDGHCVTHTEGRTLNIPIHLKRQQTFWQTH